MIKFFLQFFACYLALGNLPRFFPLPMFPNNLLVTEFLLYFLGFCFFIFYVFRSLQSVAFYCILLAILFSSAWGIFLSEAHFPSILQGLRLIFMIITGLSLGRALYLFYGSDFTRLFRFFVSSYLACIGIGFVIHLFFYSASSFWVFLAKFGVVIQGDPHYGRFVSPYFDPNLFGAIACIPFLLSQSLAKLEGKGSWKPLLFSLALLITWSRSGIATFLLLLGQLFFPKIKRLISKKLLYIFSILLLIGLIFHEQALIFFDRLIHMSRDDSALSRLTSFHWGLNLFLEFPFLGVGYNFLAFHLKEISDLSSIDSSPMATLVCFGIFFTSLFILWFLFWIAQFWIHIAPLQKRHPEVFSFLKSFSFYLFISVVFASQFNNLLYYQFWLLPMISIFSYFSYVKREE